MKYRYFDFTVESEIELPELPVAQDGAPSVILQPGLPQNSDLATFEHRFGWSADGAGEYCRVARNGRHFWLAFPGCADFVVAFPERAGLDSATPALLSHTEIVATVHHGPAPGCPPGLERHLLVNHVLPRVLGEAGCLVLHASAVRLENGRVIAFTGVTGQGKSTLAAYFCRQGAELLADDCILLRLSGDRIEVVGAAPGIRMWPDSLRWLFGEAGTSRPVCEGAVKQRMDTLPVPSTGRDPGRPRQAAKTGEVRLTGHLRALYLLEHSDEDIELEPARGAAAFTAVLRGTFNLDPTAPRNAETAFRMLGRAVDTGLPLYRLAYPRDHERLEDVRRAILSGDGSLVGSIRAPAHS